MTSRQAKKAVTREALRRAAQECFVRAGYADASIGMITSAAGVAHGTFYVHFESKEALLDELLAEFNDGLAARLVPIWSSGFGDGFGELIRRTAGLFLDYWQDRREFVLVYSQRLAQGLNLSSLRDGINPPVATLLSAKLSEMLSAMAVLINAETDEESYSAQLVSQALLAMWMRLGLQYLFNEETSREQAVDTLTKMTRGALEAVITITP